jgi:hypothetical protein
MACGLHVTKKGSYPVTVGVGFSTAEVILSTDPIAYHGISQPDVAIITSEDGMEHSRERVRQMSEGVIWLDNSLDGPRTEAEVRVRDFRKRAGPKNAAVFGLLVFLRETGIIPSEALIEAVREDPIAQHVPREILEDCSELGTGTSLMLT